MFPQREIPDLMVPTRWRHSVGWLVHKKDVGTNLANSTLFIDQIWHLFVIHVTGVLL